MSANPLPASMRDAFHYRPGPTLAEEMAAERAFRAKLARDPFAVPLPFRLTPEERAKGLGGPDYRKPPKRLTLAAASKALAWTRQPVTDRLPAPKGEGLGSLAGYRYLTPPVAGRVPLTGETYTDCDHWLAERRAALGLDG